ncbi:HTH domain-containing protein [Hoeflea sp. WL0058]|uniref:HTH domain-containing protein n=1 Tax=Flavimaribacter sediminis TaxID=2865987 RepID=A0AAE2ZSX2_9HYPH|nr:HTH domain-containing protein [Flavimaribacter sediminis]MBW8640321.1 HTH domain-containing protein [Flavimaribacter sediminis]
MDSLINSAGRALSVGDPLAALKRIALRDDAPALALRGVAMAQLGDLPRARELLRRAARAFGKNEQISRARCIVAEAEIAFVSRDLNQSLRLLGPAQATLKRLGDRVNAAHAGYLDARQHLLIGRLDEAERMIRELDADALPPASRVGFELVAAGVAIRRVRASDARASLERAAHYASETAIPALGVEVDRAMRAFSAPAGRLISNHEEREIGLAEVEALLATDALIVDACRNVISRRETPVSLATRPVLLALVRALAEAWPEDASRETLLERAFRARQSDDSHRARLRVEIARLRKEIELLADVVATKDGFMLIPHGADKVAVLAPPADSDHAEVLALLADGEAWSSSALALALGVSSRTVLRALDKLAETGRVESFGRGRACRWMAPQVPGFPTSLLLPASTIAG